MVGGDDAHAISPRTDIPGLSKGCYAVFFFHGGSHAHVREIGAHSSTPTPGGGLKIPHFKVGHPGFWACGLPTRTPAGGGHFSAVFGGFWFRPTPPSNGGGGRHFSAGFGCFWFRPTPPTIGGGVTFFSRFWMFLVPPHSANHWRGGG